MTAFNVLEIGPGLNPSIYAFENDAEYTGIDPDMHYFVGSHFDEFMVHIRAQRGDLSGFTYRRGQLIGEVIDELRDKHDLVIMANVLGDRQSYRGLYSGYFVDPETNATRQTNVREPEDLIVQALSCVKPGGTLTVVEDAVRSGNEPDHMMPEDFEQILNRSEPIVRLLGHYSIHTGADYREKVASIYQVGRIEPVAGYFDTCFIADLQRKVD